MKSKADKPVKPAYKLRYEPFPPQSDYKSKDVDEKEEDIKDKLRKISLTRLKKHKMIISKLWCSADQVDDNSDLSRALRIELKWVSDIIDENIRKEREIQYEGKMEKQRLETPEEREIREMIKRKQKARMFARIRRKNNIESINRYIKNAREIWKVKGQPFTDEDERYFRRLKLEGERDLARAQKEALSAKRKFDADAYLTSKLRQSIDIDWAKYDAAMNMPENTQRQYATKQAHIDYFNDKIKVCLTKLSPIDERKAQAEQARIESMMEYFQIGIDSGSRPPLAEGETLLDRVKQFEAEQKEIRDRAVANRRAGNPPARPPDTPPS